MFFDDGFSTAFPENEDGRMSNNEPTIFLLLIVVCALFFDTAVALEALVGTTTLTAVTAEVEARSAGGFLISMPLFGPLKAAA